jgi:hypothetical protein
MFTQDSSPEKDPVEAGYTCCFAILPDVDAEEATTAPRPVAMFETIEDAMDWGLHHYKGGAFRVRYQKYVTTSVGRPPSSVQ